ncbi:hypothetical protein RFI_14481 [Reticulomyxa filosa]|uniref:Uncharacterized protein n=1 Tax=Reticulomyxa filosa TaxID=46433 RepID=X6N8T8_RETFI|nr:hypothetical protein RFI_14481 [Reticulomyxa filosa]|eukprot:ETO22710.1 hypothetical protein RFI_14481 [Reticulomyxa filosa]
MLNFNEDESLDAVERDLNSGKEDTVGWYRTVDRLYSSGPKSKRKTELIEKLCIKIAEQAMKEMERCYSQCKEIEEQAKSSKSEQTLMKYSQVFLPLGSIELAFDTLEKMETTKTLINIVILLVQVSTISIFFFFLCIKVWKVGMNMYKSYSYTYV